MLKGGDAQKGPIRLGIEWLYLRFERSNVSYDEPNTVKLKHTKHSIHYEASLKHRRLKPLTYLYTVP